MLSYLERIQEFLKKIPKRIKMDYYTCSQISDLVLFHVFTIPYVFSMELKTVLVFQPCLPNMKYTMMSPHTSLKVKKDSCYLKL